MTQEEKDKLPKYLCMTLPYGVKIQVEGLERDVIKDKGIRTLASVLPLRNAVEYDNHGANYGVNIEQVKPYLRPITSMTEEEKEEFEIIENTHEIIREHYSLYVYQHGTCIELINWLLAHHFDFMALLPMSLAIEVTEENNPYKD